MPDRELIDRYLADRLPEDEIGAVEARIVADPAFRHEVEVTEALRAGLRRLDQTDGVEALLVGSSPQGISDRAAAFWARPNYALAASVATVGLGVLTLVLYGQLKHERELSASSRPGEVASQFGPVQRRTPIAFALLRSASEPVTIQMPSEAVLYEMAFDVGAEPAAEYALTIVKPVVDGNTVVFSAPRIVPEPDGMVRLSLHSALLTPGDYVVQLMPQGSGPTLDPGSGHALVSFRLRVVR
jgi:anti-sigma factor RsiW